MKVQLAYKATGTVFYLLDSLPPFGHCFFLLQGLVWIFLQSLLQHLKILVNWHLFSQVPKGLKLSMRWQCAVSSPQGVQHLLQVHTDMPAMDRHYKFNTSAAWGSDALMWVCTICVCNLMYSVYTYVASYINCQIALAYSVHLLYNAISTVVAVVLTVHNCRAAWA